MPPAARRFERRGFKSLSAHRVHPAIARLPPGCSLEPAEGPDRITSRGPGSASGSDTRGFHCEAGYDPRNVIVARVGRSPSDLGPIIQPDHHLARRAHDP